MSTLQRTFLLFLATAAALVCGCSRGPSYPCGTVHGNITLDGVPAPKGSVTFSPAGAGQGPVTGAQIEQGKYQCKDVPVGKHNVTFLIETGTQKIRDVANGGEHEVPVTVSPPGQEADVKTGDNPRDFTLKSK